MSTIDRKYLNAPVMVVDDHGMTRDLVRTILRGLGFINIITVENGRAAYKMLETNNVKLIVCDWNMPGGSGIELLRAVREHPQFKDVPFLMLTAEAYKESVEEAMKQGVSDYVAKPFTADVLVAKITGILK